MTPLHAQLAARNAALAAAARRERQAQHAAASHAYWSALVTHDGVVLTDQQLDALASHMRVLGFSVDNLANDNEALVTIRRVRATFDLGDLRARRDEARKELVAARDRATKLRARADASTTPEIRADLREDAAKLLTEADLRSASAAAAYDAGEEQHRRADALVERLVDRGLFGPDTTLAFPPQHHAPTPLPHPQLVRATAQAQANEDYGTAVRAAMNAVRPNTTSNPRTRQ